MGSAVAKGFVWNREFAALRPDAVKTVSKVMWASGLVVLTQFVSLTSATSCGSANVMSTH